MVCPAEVDRLSKGHLRPNAGTHCIAIPPKYPVASVIGFLKGKSAIDTAFGNAVTSLS